MSKIFAIALLCLAGAAHAQIPVTVTTDIPAGVNQMQTMAEWGKTAKSWAAQAKDMAANAKAWISQYTQMKEQYDAITGIRNFGDIFNNKVLRRNVPDDWSGVYDTAGDAALVGEEAAKISKLRTKTAQVRATEALVDTVDNDLARVQKRARDMPAVNKAVGQNAYKNQPGVLGIIENIMGKINTTTDQKSILDLQGRLMGETALQQHNTNNILLMARLQENEKDLATEQRLGLSQRIIGNNGGGMPSIGEP